MQRTRRAAASHANASAKAFEERVASQLEVMRQQGRVPFFAHTQPAFIRTSGGFRPSGKGHADFFGVLRGSCSWAAEVKTTAERRFYRKQIEKHPLQIDHLDSVARSGGVALLIIEFRTDPETMGQAVPFPRAFAIPWPRVPWATALTSKSIQEADLGGFEMQRPFLQPFVGQCEACNRVWPAGWARCLCGAPMPERPGFIS